MNILEISKFKVFRRNTEEKEIKKLVERAKFNIEADNLKEATYKLRKAMEIAKNIGNEELQNKIVEFFESISCVC